MALALRISEICPLRINQIEFYRKTIAVYEEKTNRIIEKHVPDEIFEVLVNYIDTNKKQIKDHENYLWFSEGANGKKLKELHLSKDYLRKVFRAALTKSGLKRVYAKSKDGRDLHVLSTHSFRRTGITKMAEALNGDVFKLKQYSGHTTTSSLEKYVQLSNKEEINQKIDEVFSGKTKIEKLKKWFE